MTAAQLWPNATEMTGNNRQVWAEAQTETGRERERETATEDAPSGCCRRIYHGCRQTATATAEGRDLDRICRRSGYLRGVDF